MESDGVLGLYQRSIEKHNLRYSPFIGDGDSSAYKTIESTMPYGPLRYIPKAECTNHVTKRMGTGLRTLIQSHKGIKCFAVYGAFGQQKHV